MKKRLLVITMLLLCSVLAFAVPPHPEKNDELMMSKGKASDFFKDKKNRSVLPQNVLAIRVQFSDVTFSEGNDEGEIPHNKEYFERIMFHLQTFYKNASHDTYEFNYDVLDEIITLPKEMGYYGDDKLWDSRVVEFFNETIELADPHVDFNNYTYDYRGQQYAAVILFHAGAGQESDVTGNNTNELWSTFLTISDIKEVLDPGASEYFGISTDDDVYIAEVSVCPESQTQPDSDDNTPNYGVLGVVAHEYGHQIGLPTLFDNDRSDGRSAGIGNFGIMGTGSWNANGHVPPLPCAWSRYYLGWETPVEINKNSSDNYIGNVMTEDSGLPTLYKVNISDEEYFLLENRQQNPDKSTLNGFPNFTFKLLPDGEQDYYDNFPNVPVFNFMENSYDKAEWDFFFPGPGYGDPPGEDNVTIDGSGLFIWHIDERIIENKMTENLDVNSINGDATHRGVDLEEADGVQHMDTYIPNQYMFGGPYDSFRDGNNVYFGHENYYPNDDSEVVYYGTPNSQSYYGNSSVEIKNISNSGNVMSFDVAYDWHVQNKTTGENSYVGECHYAPLVFNEGENDRIFYPFPNGVVAGWIEKSKIDGFPINLEAEIVELYSVDKNDNIWFPVVKNDEAGVICLDKEGNILIEEYFGEYTWNAPISFEINEETGHFGFFALNSETEAMIYQISDDGINNIYTIEGNITSNIVVFPVIDDFHNDFRIKFGLNNDSKNHIGIFFTNGNNSLVEVPQLLEDETILFLSDYIRSSLKTENKIYSYQIYDSTFHEKDHFTFPQTVAKTFNYSDIEGNNSEELLLGDRNRFYIINNQDEEIYDFAAPLAVIDSVSTAVSPLVVYLNNKKHIIQTIGGNRLMAWENPNNINELDVAEDFPKLQRYQSRTMPVFVPESNRIYIGTDNGRVYRYEYDSVVSYSEWNSEYGNLQRNSTRFYNNENSFAPTPFKFDEARTMFYPNPYRNGVHSNVGVRFLIGVNNTAEVKVRLYDIAGNLVIDKKVTCYANDINKNRVQIPTKKLSTGVYIAVISANGQSLQRKLMIEK